MRKVVLAGVDTLEVGFCIEGYNLAESEWFMLAEAKEMAKSVQFDTDGGRIDFRGQLFAVLPTGTRQHQYILKNNDITLKIKPEYNGGAAYPEVQVRFSSEFLWRDGYMNAYSHVKEWLGDWAYICAEKVSRVDISVDINDGLPKIDRNHHEVVTRAQRKSTIHTIKSYARGSKLNTLTIGSGDCLCRIYDKIEEIKTQSRKEWFYDLWKNNGYQEGDSVTRVEFQLRRDFLRTMQVETVDDLNAQIGDLWSYLTTKWLTLRKKGKDSNRSRWEIKPFWRVVQEALTLFGEPTGVIRVRQYKPKFTALKQQARGIMVTMAATVDMSMGLENSVSYGKKFVRQEIARMLDDPFIDLAIKRREAKLASLGLVRKPLNRTD
ncbi:MAG: hypothetical protein HOC20_04910 [Chloroflexi bacterium]|jgi:hypothetical protein|nr:hypothetical protein [Chloroflexota bacterium]